MKVKMFKSKIRPLTDDIEEGLLKLISAADWACEQSVGFEKTEQVKAARRWIMDHIAHRAYRKALDV